MSAARRLWEWLGSRADDVAAGLLAAMFATFFVQIVARYILLPLYPGINIGWTVELCLTLWLWSVFWGAAFCLREGDHVRFDMLYLAVGRRTRRGMAIAAALLIAGGLLMALPATWDYIAFYKIKKSAVLRWRLDYVFSIYGIFAAVVTARYLWRAVALLRGSPLDEETALLAASTEAGDPAR
ncbi:MAG: TRAP transporter small permease subunit [Mesorhizobium sp.]|nr:TRAP transporter small permease subunit [Mesorhizobium sp.]MCO5162975.1 TRAP transporter small permease subunit [Mesorhizobium sp.]